MLTSLQEVGGGASGSQWFDGTALSRYAAPYSLAAYGWARKSDLIDILRNEVRSGMISINHNGLGLPEVPFGGILDSGFGDEGGVEALREMMFSRFVSVRSAR